MNHILVIEDDRALNEGLQYDLEAEGYGVFAAFNRKQALELWEKQKIDCIILDVNLPDGNGFDLCRVIRKQSDVPIIFLTACDLEEEQMKGFTLGADDYITKPFSMQILHKRIEVALRHSGKIEKESIYKDGYLTIDFEKRSILREKEAIFLTPNEFKLLQILMVHKKMVVTKQMLLEKIWDVNENFVEEHAVAVTINRLRGKLEQKGHSYIKTVYGMGYQWIGESYE